MFESVPYGANLTNSIYSTFESWVADSQIQVALNELPEVQKDGEVNRAKCDYKGHMKVLGKSLALAPAHLLNAVAMGPAMILYDLVMSVFFLVANLCTAFIFSELRERLGGHLASTGSQVVEIFKNLFATICPPFAYRAFQSVEAKGQSTMFLNVHLPEHVARRYETRIEQM